MNIVSVFPTVKTIIFTPLPQKELIRVVEIRVKLVWSVLLLYSNRIINPLVGSLSQAKLN